MNFSRTFFLYSNILSIFILLSKIPICFSFLFFGGKQCIIFFFKQLIVSYLMYFYFYVIFSIFFHQQRVDEDAGLGGERHVVNRYSINTLLIRGFWHPPNTQVQTFSFTFFISFRFFYFSSQIFISFFYLNVFPQFLFLTKYYF